MQCAPDALAVLKQHSTNNGCTKILWAERVAGVLHRESPVTLVNVRSNPSTSLPLPVRALMCARQVGANKGYKVSGWARATASKRWRPSASCSALPPVAGA